MIGYKTLAYGGRFSSFLTLIIVDLLEYAGTHYELIGTFVHVVVPGRSLCF